MKSLRVSIGLTVALAGALMGAGCSSSSSQPQMTEKDVTNFSGKKGGGPPSAAKQKAMADFQTNFQKLHPSSGGPGVPPAGQ